MMDAIELLKHQHEEALGMIARLKSDEEMTEGSRLELFDKLKEALTLHTKMEEELFYPALEHFEETRSLVAESYQEHRRLDQLLQKMSGLKGGRSSEAATNQGSVDWPSLLDELRTDVMHHVSEEENELFPKARKLLTRDRIQEMGDRMRGVQTGQSKIDQLIYPARRVGPV